MQYCAGKTDECEDWLICLVVDKFVAWPHYYLEEKNKHKNKSNTGRLMEGHSI